MKNTDCYFYFEQADMGAHIPCCFYKEYGLGECPCDDCTNYVPQSKVSQIVREYLEHKAIPSADMFSDLKAEISMYENSDQSIDEMIQGIKSIISIYER